MNYALATILSTLLPIFTLLGVGVGTGRKGTHFSGARAQLRILPRQPPSNIWAHAVHNPLLLPIRHETESFLVQLRTFDVLGSQRMIFGFHRRLPLHTATSISVAVPAHQHRARLKYHTPHAMVLRCQVGYDGDPRRSRGVPAAESLKRPTSRSFHPRLSAAGRCSPLGLS